MGRRYDSERDYRRQRPRSNKPYNDDFKDDFYDDEELLKELEDDEEMWERRDSYERRPSNRERYSDYEENRRSSGRYSDYEDDRRDRNRREAGRYSDYEDDRRDRNRREAGRYSDYEDDRRDRNRREAGRYSDYEDDRRDRRRRGSGGCLGCLIPLILFVGVVVAAVFLGISLMAGRMQNAGFSQGRVQYNSDLNDSTKKAMNGYRNILLFGVDSRNQNPLEQGALADSCMLLSINKKNGKIQLVSFYRDTYVETTDGSHMKLTEVYSTYGPQEAIQTINRNFDLNISEYVTYTWAAVAEYINGIGGMDIEITSAEADGINTYIDEVINNTGIDSEYVSEDISSEGEVCHLDGVQAVTYCRLRKGLGDDYKRTERQRTVVTHAVNLAKKNPLSAVKSAYHVLPMIASSLNTTDIVSLMTGLTKYELENSEGFPYDVRDTSIGGASYLYSYTVIGNNRELHAKLFENASYEASGTVEDIHSRQAEIFGY